MSSAAAGIRRYCLFCDLLDVPYFPPTSGVVPKWSDVFSPGRTFALYVSHLANASHPMGYGLEWRPSAVYGVARGLENAMGLSLKTDNYWNFTLCRRVVLAETLVTSFGKFVYLSFMFVLRGPSGSIPSQRAPLKDRLDTKVHQAEKALLRLRRLNDGSTRLIPKLNRRKNFRRSAPLMRPCFRDSQEIVPV